MVRACAVSPVACMALVLLGWCVANIATMSTARACSCAEPEPSAEPYWPANGARDVPIQPALWFRAYSAANVPKELQGPDGSRVVLETIRTLASNEVCAPDTVIMRPVEPLQRNTSYSVLLGTAYGQAQRALFTTGTSDRWRLPHVSLDLRLYRLQGVVNGVEVLVDSTASSDAPTWLTVSVEGPSEKERSISLGQTKQPFYLALGSKLPAPCVTYELIDANAEVRAREKRCDADRCVVSEGEWLETDSTCSAGRVPYGAELWDRVPEESCSSLPRVVETDSGFIVAPEGCSAAQGMNAKPQLTNMLLIASALALARWRRPR